jgi:hypothetical protein
LEKGELLLMFSLTEGHYSNVPVVRRPYFFGKSRLLWLDGSAVPLAVVKIEGIGVSVPTTARLDLAVSA